jgi:hypothetical protein
MPKLSDTTILGRAIDPAILDRESFSGAYGGEGPESEEALGLAEKIRSLRGKRFASLTAEEAEIARLTLIYAEQWERSLSDSQAQIKEKKAAAKLASMYREMRMRRWGRTVLEQVVAEAQVVEIFPRNRVRQLLDKGA